MKEYSYINKNGELVKVTEEHLLTAVRIKLALQDASPSRRASWKKVKDLMEEEGYFDADNTESYRLLVKNFQEKNGLFPNSKSLEQSQTQGALESIKELVGELSYEKRENQNVLRQINKGKRELIDFGLILNEIVEEFKKHDFTKLNINESAKNLEDNFEDEFKDGTELIVCLSDLHIGALVDTDENTYNYNKAIERISKYVARVVELAEKNNVDKINVVGLGDMIEHANMRYGQGFDAEFNFSEQIVKASDLIIKLLYFLVQKGYQVTYSAIAGNHDRITDKDKNLDNDHAVKVINKVVESFFNNIDNQKFKYIETSDYSHSLNVNGLSVICVHGDLDSKKDNGIIRKHEVLNKESYDLMLMGHFHSVEIREISDDKYLAIAGSLKGKDNYSKNKIRKSSSPSQLIVIVDKDGNYNFDIVKFE